MLRNVRVTYSKQDRMKFISHLDMNRYMTRLIKISKIPAWHTEGFNKHLYLTFALPLSLGITTDYDIVDLKIIDDDFTDEMIVDALNKNAAQGLHFISAGPIVMKTAELSFALYELTVKDSNLNYLNAFKEFSLGKVMITEKKGKKGKVTLLNVAEKIKKIDCDIEDNQLKISVILPAGNTENINPTLILNAFKELGNREPEVFIVNRKMLYNAALEEFK